MAWPRSIVIKHVLGNNYPLELVLCRTMTATDRETVLTGAVVTMTVNDIAITGSVTSVAAGTVEFALPSSVVNLAANVSPGYVVTVRVVDGEGYTRDIASGRWLQMEID